MYLPFQQYAHERIQHLQQPSVPQWRQALQHFAQRGKWQYVVVFLLSAIAFPFVLIGAIVAWLWQFLRSKTQ